MFQTIFFLPRLELFCLKTLVGSHGCRCCRHFPAFVHFLAFNMFYFHVALLEGSHVSVFTFVFFLFCSFVFSPLSVLIACKLRGELHSEAASMR